MGVRTDGQICYGIVFDEDHEFPWEDRDIEDWWRETNGFKPSEELYTPEGEYIGGVKPSQNKIDAYYKERRDWDEVNPIPVELVNYCSGDCPMMIVAVPSTLISASRGYPERISPSLFNLNDQALTRFNEFCEKFDIKGENPAQWYLSSYWG